MSFNRSLLTQITKDLNKKPSKPKVPKNQWQHPGEITTIPSNNITMDAVSYPVLGVPNFGQPQMMYPDQQYHFPEADNVTEYPMMAKGGYTVTRSNDRKGKTHKVTGPDGTVKYFGDSKLGQHPKDPERKAAFYARHKKNLDANPYFRAFARATWQTGGESEDPMQYALSRMKMTPSSPTMDQIETVAGFIPGIESAIDLKDMVMGAVTGNYAQMQRGKIGAVAPLSGKALMGGLDMASPGSSNAINEVLNMSKTDQAKLFKKYGYGGYDQWVKAGRPKLSEGGQTRNEREMVNGIADILSQIRDPQNRAEIAKQMMSDFRRDNVTYNPQDFMDMAELKQGGEMIRRADGSYSRRGLWDNIRANKGSGKKPTKEMLEQERKIKSKMQFGGLWDTNRTAWVDSVNNANMGKNFVQRMYNANAPEMFLPGSKKPSTHFMESGDGRVYPTVVQRPGNKFLEWLNQNNPDGAMNYALDSGQYIQFPHDEQAQWYGQNGYKSGTGVVTGKKKKYGGLAQYQKAGQVIKPMNGGIDLSTYGIDVFTPQGIARAEELNKQYPGTKFYCTANGCADIASKVANAYGHEFGRFNAWDAGNQNPVAFMNPRYTEEMINSTEPLPNPTSYKVPTQVLGMQNKILTLNRNNNLMDEMGNKLSITQKNINKGKSKDRKSSNDSFDYKYNYANSRGMEHTGYLKGDNMLVHGSAGHDGQKAWFVFDDIADGIRLPGYGQYDVVEAIDEPSALRRGWNRVSNSVRNIGEGASNILSKVNAPVKTSPGVNNQVASMFPNPSRLPQMVNQGINIGSKVVDKVRRAIPVGESIVDYLGQQGIQYDKATRKAIAAHLGIDNYNFSAAKNIELMKRIAQAPEILDRFVKPKAQFGFSTAAPMISNTLTNMMPVNVRAFGNMATAAMSSNKNNAPFIQKSDLSKENLSAIYNAAQNAYKRTGKTHQGTMYSDYGKEYGDIWNMGVPDAVKSSGISSLAKIPFQLGNIGARTIMDPIYQAATSLGRFTYTINPDGSVGVEDTYDFSNENTGNAVKGFAKNLDNKLGKDPRKNVRFNISPSDFKRHGGYLQKAVVGMENPFFPKLNPEQEAADAQAQMPDDTNPFGVYDAVSHEGAGIAGQMKTKIEKEAAASSYNNSNQKKDKTSNPMLNPFMAINTFTQGVGLYNKQQQEEANRQMLRSQNATWNQQYDSMINRGNFSQGPSSYGMFRPNATFAQQGMEVPLSMDAASKYTVDSIDSQVGVNTIGVGLPDVEFAQPTTQVEDSALQSPEQVTPTNVAAPASEGDLKEIIAQRESGGNYKALPYTKKGTLASSAAGKYQFLWDTHADTIRTVTGVKSKSQFLNNPDAQEAYFDYWDKNVLTPNAQKIQQQYKPNLNTNEIKMLIHFQGPQGADRYFRTGKYTTDAFGSNPMNYLGRNISTKKGVNMDNLHPNLASFASTMSQYFPGLKISSANDSKHMKGSKHYANKAIDIGANSSDPVAYNRLKNFLGQSASVKRQYGIEDIINEGDHLHVELMQTGGEYELTADQIMQIKAMGGDVEFI